MSDRVPGHPAAGVPRSTRARARALVPQDRAAVGAPVRAAARGGTATEDRALSAIQVPRRLMGATAAIAFFNHPGGFRDVHAFDVPGEFRSRLRCFLDRHRAELEEIAAGDAMIAIAEGEGFVVLAPLHGIEPGHLFAIWFERRATPLLESEELLVEVLISQLSADLSRETREEERISAAVGAERERISRDLHDVVAQRVFATGLQLKGLVSRPELASGREVISEVIAQLDLTLGDLRSAIFELSQGWPADPVESVTQVVHEYERSFGTAPEITCTGDLGQLEPAVCDHVLATLRELLSNAARHADATRVWIDLSLRAGQVTLVVSDDGCGLTPGARGNGLENLRTRALLLGGSFVVAERPVRGTTVTWEVPVQRSGAQRR